MGTLEKDDGVLVFKQDDGEITARFIRYEEKTQLTHEGSTSYKKVFHLMIIFGLAYLAVVFWVY